MAATTNQLGRAVAEKQAIALLSLNPEQLNYARELRELFHNAADEQEKHEIVLAFAELIYPEGSAKVGKLERGVSAATKKMVAAYHGRVGAAIKRRREAMGLTQERLAELAGLPQSHISRLESGKHAPTHLTIKKLAKALGTKPKVIDPGYDA